MTPDERVANIESTVVQVCIVEGKMANAESVRIGIYLDNSHERRRIIVFRLRDKLERDGAGWRIISREATIEAAFHGEVTQVIAGGPSSALAT